MSAWYLFSAMGFYPVTPGSNEFAIGAPQLPEIKIQLKDHELTIKAENLSEENQYVQSVFLDGKKLLKPFINYFDLIGAKELRFIMGNKQPSTNKPNYNTTLLLFYQSIRGYFANKEVLSYLFLKKLIYCPILIIRKFYN